MLDFKPFTDALKVKLVMTTIKFSFLLPLGDDFITNEAVSANVIHFLYHLTFGQIYSLVKSFVEILIKIKIYV